MPPEITHWVNGKFVPASQAVMPLNSRGYRLGDAVYDTERTFKGKLFKLPEHLERLGRSLKMARIDPGMSLEELGKLAEETTERNRHLLDEYGDFWVSETIHRGEGGNPLKPGPSFVSIIVEPLSFARFAPHYTKGAHLVTPSGRSSGMSGLDPKLKSVSRLSMVLADLETKAVDPESWTLLMDEENNLAEVLYGNLFVVRGGKLRTPGGRTILEGITRATTMQLAGQEGIPVHEQAVQPYDLYTAEEAFITTTSYVMLPVSQFNGAKVGEAIPGPITRQLTEAWKRLVGMDFVEQMQRFSSKVGAARTQQPVPMAAHAARG
jgi:branched-chain amino acid aminotransferase